MSLLIIQTGDAVDAARPHGNFNDWFIKAAGALEAITVNVHQGQNLPKADEAKDRFSHIIITGSAAMITEHSTWMTQTQKWLELVIETMPIMGVCFGHQMLADLLGGKVDYNPKGRNMGRDMCHLNETGKKCPLFTGINGVSFHTCVSHSQAVLTPPENSTVLASSPKDPNHAFQYGNKTFGLQFHPEWTGPIMAAYIETRKQALAEEGFDVSAMLTATSQNFHTDQIIKNFVQL